MTPITQVVLTAFSKLTNAVNTFIQKIDFVQTFQNIVTNTNAFITLYQKQLRAFFDLIPDLFKSAMSKLVPNAVPFLENFLSAVKEVALVAFEPLVVAISHVGQRIKQGFTTIINGLLEGVNFLIEKTNALNPFSDIPKINLLDSVQVDPLLEKLQETKIGQFVTPTEDDIQTFTDYLEVTQGNLAEYYESIKVMKEENDESENTSNNKIPLFF